MILSSFLSLALNGILIYSHHIVFSVLRWLFLLGPEKVDDGKCSNNEHSICCFIYEDSAALLHLSGTFLHSTTSLSIILLGHSLTHLRHTDDQLECLHDSRGNIIIFLDRVRETFVAM